MMTFALRVIAMRDRDATTTHQMWRMRKLARRAGQRSKETRKQTHCAKHETGHRTAALASKFSNLPLELISTASGEVVDESRPAVEPRCCRRRARLRRQIAKMPAPTPTTPTTNSTIAAICPEVRDDAAERRENSEAGRNSRGTARTHAVAAVQAPAAAAGTAGRRRRRGAGRSAWPCD